MNSYMQIIENYSPQFFVVATITGLVVLLDNTNKGRRIIGTNKTKQY